MYSHISITPYFLQSQVHWTSEVESCLSSNHASLARLIDHHQSYSATLSSTASLLKSETLLPSKRCVVSSLLTLDIHDRDVIGRLIQSKVSSNKDFEWARHLRYYWDNSNNTCFLRQSCASFQYVNEYLGCLPRLVITPLSERCYLTLTTAMHLHLGGSPIGPAGTGKSETVKDLAKVCSISLHIHYVHKCILAVFQMCVNFLSCRH